MCHSGGNYKAPRDKTTVARGSSDILHCCFVCSSVCVLFLCKSNFAGHWLESLNQARGKAQKVDAKKAFQQQQQKQKAKPVRFY